MAFEAQGSKKVCRGTVQTNIHNGKLLHGSITSTTCYQWLGGCQALRSFSACGLPSVCGVLDVIMRADISTQRLELASCFHLGCTINTTAILQLFVTRCAPF